MQHYSNAILAFLVIIMKIQIQLDESDEKTSTVKLVFMSKQVICE